MKINLTFLTFILVVLIIYLFVYQILPTYRATLSLVKEYNLKQSQKEKVLNLKNNLEALENDPIFQQLLSNRQKFNAYLPEDPSVERIVYDLLNHYQTLNLSNFPGLTYRLKDSDFTSKLNLPTKVKTVEFSFRDSMNYPTLVSLLKLVEANIRIFAVKNVRILKDKQKQILNVDFTVDSYYLTQ